MEVERQSLRGRRLLDVFRTQDSNRVVCLIRPPASGLFYVHSFIMMVVRAMDGSDGRDGHVRVSFDEFAAPTREEWYKEAVAVLKGAPFENKMYMLTYEGIMLEPIL